MNSSDGVNSGGVGVNNLKESLGRANSTSNVPGMNKSNKGKKPSFREVPTSEKPNLFIRKLNMCCVAFDFNDPSKNLKEKDIKR
ncbi:hypothetical protein GIB67_037935 [Kingdonia uniflora]|uniref:Uncharacterized protein n=1 Tax=Kingdonia uniflora TaxID=39325 RepID=A0A7J7LH61_9MAGN|nr:hypothetical protein GIB67_037935 [Kingdonia uniflora]